MKIEFDIDLASAVCIYYAMDQAAIAKELFNRGCKEIKSTYIQETGPTTAHVIAIYEPGPKPTIRPSYKLELRRVCPYCLRVVSSEPANQQALARTIANEYPIYNDGKLVVILNSCFHCMED